jgi:hypothetical protein
MRNKTCRYCNRPLMRIDHNGEMLIGCIDCNRWGHPDNKKLIMEMLEDDLEALRASERKRHPPH